MSGDAVKRWLMRAPLTALIIVAFSFLATLSAWVWVVAGEVKDQRAMTVIAAQAAANVTDDQRNLIQRMDRVEMDTTARLTQHEGGTEARLTRIETKVDRLLDQVATMRSRYSPEERKP